MKTWFGKNKVLAIIIAAVILVTSVTTVTAVTLNSKGKQTLLDRVLEEDGFLYGTNFVWTKEGHTWADNEIRNYTDNYMSDDNGAEKMELDLINLKNMGFNAVKTVLSGFYLEGIRFDEYGNAIELTQQYKDNIRTFLDIVKKTNTNLAVILEFHTEGICNEVSKEAWDKYTQYYTNEAACRNYLNVVISPILDILKDYEDNILFISLGNELENLIQDSDMDTNTASDRTIYGVSFDNMYRFYKMINELCIEKMPNTPRTIDTNGDFLNKYEDFGLTFIGRNQYSGTAQVSPIKSYKTSLPVCLTEFGMGTFTNQAAYNNGTMKMLKAGQEAGYIGAFFWAHTPWAGGNANDAIYRVFNPEFRHRADFNELGCLFRYKYLDDQYARDGIEDPFDAPAMLTHEGKGIVSWVNSRQAETFDLERSTDAGQTWDKILTDAACEDYISKNNVLMGTYKDENIAAGDKICYRITARNSDGKSATSNVSNVYEIQPEPPNLWLDGDFESGNLDNYEQHSSSEIIAEAAHSGNYGLKVQGTAWQQIVQNFDLIEGKRYKFSCWYKIADPEDLASACLYVYIRNGPYGSSTDNLTCFLNHDNGVWTYMEASFTAKADMHVSISVGNPPKAYYIDDITLREE